MASLSDLVAIATKKMKEQKFVIALSGNILRFGESSWFLPRSIIWKNCLVKALKYSFGKNPGSTLVERRFILFRKRNCTI